MAGSSQCHRNILLCIFMTGLFSSGIAVCNIPLHLQGSFFSIESGEDQYTTIKETEMDRDEFRGVCTDSEIIPNTTDANGRYSANILFYDSGAACYRCFEMRFRTMNVVQYKMSTCQSKETGTIPELHEVCDTIRPDSDYYSFFKKTYQIVNCKNTFEGVFAFSYEWNYGGGGICESDQSRIVACQEPGSQYVDNQVFTMSFGSCPEVSTSLDKEIRFRCLGTWVESHGDEDLVWSVVEDMVQDVDRERYRCMLTTYGQEEGDNKRRYTMSWWADCSELKSPYEGPLRLMLQPVVGDRQLLETKPECNFPTNYSGHWYHTGEWDVNVDINQTHMYFKTDLDIFNYKEVYFTCLMNSGTRFLVTAVTVGKCEIDYVCFDMLPRHHSIIRWRMGKPYRLTDVEKALPNYRLFMFQQACEWYSFTIDREVINWNYRTLLLNPPSPVPCPIRGRYRFEQSGPQTELIRTRIKGITERPRHTIDCYEQTPEWKSCDDNPTKISLDVEYCETVDHTGQPVGEYDEPDWELTCVGYWGEDWVSYMITWDPEDATSAFRCWAFERTDWRYVQVSRSTTANCNVGQTPYTTDPVIGGSLAMRLVEKEREFDDCAQDYKSGNPFIIHADYITSKKGQAASLRSQHTLILCSFVLFVSFFKSYL